MENQILLDKIGDTKTQKLIDDCNKIYKENFTKQFPKYFDNNFTKACSLVCVTEKNEIKSIGMSCLNDLLLDNWGNFLNGFMGGNSSAQQLRQTSGTFRTVGMWGGAQSLWNSTSVGSTGSSISVGTGTTPATRQDFVLETSVLGLGMGNGGYNSGLAKIDIPAQNISTIAFSLSETGLFGVWAHSTPPATVGSFMLSRDNISPVASVIIGNTVSVDYTLLLS